MIIVTGAAGFIGSCLTSKLNNKGLKEILLVDDFSDPVKNRNLANKSYTEKVDRNQFFSWLTTNHKQVDLVFHIGARTDTTEFNWAIFDELNLNYSKSMWNACSEFKIPLIYASSAATYGDGALGYLDDHALIPHLLPLNPYGVSKNEFDKWVLLQPQTPPYWFGLKFFNVFGPNEYHKGRMASVIWHAFNQINKNGVVKLFKSHRPDFKDGQQLRDFIYVKDLLKVIDWMALSMLNSDWDLANNGLYNLGTGKARSFYDLAAASFKGLDLKPNIEFIEMPEDLRETYQYFTEANMLKLQKAGYTNLFYTLEEGVDDYVRNYLKTLKYM